MKELQLSDFKRLLKKLPRGTFFLNQYTEEVRYNADKEYFIWDGWDYYNDTEGRRIWKIDDMFRITMKGNTIYCENEYQVKNNQRKGYYKSYDLTLRVFFPANNIGFYLEK